MAESRVSPSPESDLAVTDSDIETINTEELVIFDSIQTFYSNQRDIVVFYTLGKSVENTSRDWIGLFKRGWQTIDEFSTYQWVPCNSLNSWQARRRRTIFPQADIAKLCGDFQFVYITLERQILGVSDNFLLSESDASKPSLSLSLISLETLSSSDDNESLEITDGSVNSNQEQIIPKPAFAEPQFAPLSTQQDNWTLSDFVIGQKYSSVLEKLYFQETWDSTSLVDEYEPLKQFYLSLRAPKGILVEEIIPESDSAATCSAKEGLSSSELVTGETSKKCTVAVWNSPLFPIWNEVFQQPYFGERCQKFLTMAPQKKLTVMFPTKSVSKMSLSHQFDALETEKDPKDSRRWLVPVNCATRTDQFDTNKIHINEISKQSRFVFYRGQPEESDGNRFPRVLPGYSQEVVISLAETKSKSVISSSSRRDLRKKRSILRSKIKSHRDNQDIMLKEAMDILNTKVPALNTAADAGSDDKIPDTSAAEIQFKLGTRKRPSKTTPGICKAKRRRLAGMKTKPSIFNPCTTEDDGYFSADDDDSESILQMHSSNMERLEVLSLALTESLKTNAELRQQISLSESHKTKKLKVESDITTSSHLHTPRRRVKKLTTASTATSSEREKCTIVSSSAKVLKKDGHSQYFKTTTGKATNTALQKTRHTASNTTSIAKKNTHSQCLKPETTGKSTNTTPASPKKDAEINTQVVQKSESSTQSSSSKPDLIQLTPIGVIVSSAVQQPPPSADLDSSGTVCGPDDCLAKWKIVSSKKLSRLRRVIAKKREEFASLRENVQNYEKRNQTLEAQLRSMSSALSTETLKRLDAERDLQELRSKFWQLLAARKSQAWSTAPCTCSMLINFSSDQKTQTNKPLTFPKPLSSSKKLNIAAMKPNNMLKKLADSGEVFPGLSETCNKLTATENPFSLSEDALNPSQISRMETQSIRSKETSILDMVKSDEGALPLLSTAHFKNVPVQIRKVKRAQSGTISFKKFLMPAMTAIAETFSSSKPKNKNRGVLPPATAESLSESTVSEGPVAKVKMSLSAGAFSKSYPKIQKTDIKHKKSRHSSKENTKLENCELHMLETITMPKDSNDPTLLRSPVIAQAKSDKSDTGEKAASSQGHSVQEVEILELTEKIKDAKSVETEIEVDNSSWKRLEDASEWFPLTELAMSATNNSATTEQITAMEVQPTQLPFPMPKPIGKGRPFSSVNTCIGKLTRNELARAIRSAQHNWSVNDLTKTASQPSSDRHNATERHSYVIDNAYMDATESYPLPPLSVLLKSRCLAQRRPITSAPCSKEALVVTREFPDHGRPKTEKDVHHAQSSRPPCALHDDFVSARSDPTVSQIHQGMCLTCGMKFSSAVDRQLVEQHVYFHHTRSE